MTTEETSFFSCNKTSEKCYLYKCFHLWQAVTSSLIPSPQFKMMSSSLSRVAVRGMTAGLVRRSAAAAVPLRTMSVLGSNSRIPSLPATNSFLTPNTWNAHNPRVFIYMLQFMITSQMFFTNIFLWFFFLALGRCRKFDPGPN